MAKNDGWVKIYRSLFDDPLWTKEPFTRGQAWVDLIMMVNHEDGEFINHQGNAVKVPRGSCFTSIQKLADRWHWSPNKVRRYIGTLTDMQMVKQTGEPTGTLLSLVKYDDFQGGRRTGGTTDGRADGRTDGTRTRNNKEIEEGKNARAARPHHKTLAEKLAAIEERRQRLEREEQEAAEREREKKTDD